MKELTTELDEKLAKSAGFTWYDEPCSCVSCSGHCGWRYPDGNKVHPLGMLGLPHFTGSLDSSFKWVVPENAEVEIRENLIGQFTSVEVKTRDGKSGMGVTRWGEESDRLKRTATSLCRALEQLIDDEEK